MKWQPISTAPKDGTPIFACIKGECYTGHGFLPVCVRWGTFHPNAVGKETWRASHGYKVAHLTHWMPLPAPPKETK